MFWKYNIWGFISILLIFIASATPGDQLPPSPFFDFDKVVHSFIYGILQICLLRGFLLQQSSPILKKHYMLFATCISADYGVLMEIMQGYVFRNRSFDWYDAIANVAGVMLGSLIFIYFFQKKIKQKLEKNA